MNWWYGLVGWFTSDRIIALATVGYLFVTVVMARLVHFQRKDHRSALKIATQNVEALRSAERPWIEVGIEYPRINGIPLTTVLVTFTNFGKTPAKVTEIVISRELQHGIQYLPWPPAHSTDIEGLDGETLIAPSASFERAVDLTPMPRDLSAPENLTNRFINGFVWLYGLVHYADSEGKPHTTYYCYARKLPIWEASIVRNRTMTDDERRAYGTGFRKRGPARFNSYT
jgi:hypothetical protein